MSISFHIVLIIVSNISIFAIFFWFFKRRFERLCVHSGFLSRYCLNESWVEVRGRRLMVMMVVMVIVALGGFRWQLCAWKKVNFKVKLQIKKFKNYNIDSKLNSRTFAP